MIGALPSQTAEVVCWMRAAEHLRPADQRIVDDPFAAAFLSAPYRLALRPLGATVSADPLQALVPGLTTLVLARHRYIDEALLAALPLDQVVLLGAGYDSRLHRLRLGSARGFEVDHPSTAARKGRLVESDPALAAAPIVRVPVDFERESLAERLVGSGFARDRRTFWAWEGVSMYLERDAIEHTLRTARSLSGPGSRLAMDFLERPHGTGLVASIRRAAPAVLGLVGEPVTFTVGPDGARDLLGSTGWRVVDLADADELTRRFVPDGRRVYPDGFVVTAGC